MADNTAIEWAEATLNYINGCTRMSPGCGGPGPHGGCYAERLAGTRLRDHPSRIGLTKQTPAGPRWTGEVRPWPAALEQALRWKRGRNIFWNAHGDIGHDKVTDEMIDAQFAVCAMTPQHTHMLLTKRPDRLLDYLTTCPASLRINAWRIAARTLGRELGDVIWPLPNVWIGTSVESRQYMLDRGPLLAQIPAALRFWSIEPLLGDLGEIPVEFMPDGCFLGGESGPLARPMHPDWARSARDQFVAAGKNFMFKQWGEWIGGEVYSLVDENDVRHGGMTRCQDGLPHPGKPSHWWSGDTWGGIISVRVGKKIAGRELDGREWNSLPDGTVI